MVEPVDRETAAVAREHFEVGEDAVGKLGDERLHRLIDDGPVLLGAIRHRVEFRPIRMSAVSHGWDGKTPSRLVSNELVHILHPGRPKPLARVAKAQLIRWVSRNGR